MQAQQRQNTMGQLQLDQLRMAVGNRQMLRWYFMSQTGSPQGGQAGPSLREQGILFYLCSLVDRCIELTHSRVGHFTMSIALGLFGTRSARRRINERYRFRRIARLHANLAPLAVTFRSTLSGTPGGASVVLEFASSFERKAAAIETVTPMKDEDGTWRVCAYYIK